MTKSVRFIAILSVVYCPALLFAGPGYAVQRLRANRCSRGEWSIHFAIAKTFHRAAEGNPRPDTGRAVLMFPPGFDPARRWPILVVTSTSDFNRTSAMDTDWYRKLATAEGWVVLGSGRHHWAAPRYHPAAARDAGGGAGSGSSDWPEAAMAPGFRGLCRRLRNAAASWELCWPGPDRSGSVAFS